MTDYRLETFLCLCQTMNYRVAAEKLNITQPAVSQHIKALEQQYKCRLFIYDKRRLSMTPEAELLRRHALSIQLQEQKLMEKLSGRRLRQLNIGATKTIGEYVIRRQVERLLEEPDTRFSLEIDNTVNILRHIDEGKLDFALVEGYFDRARYAHRLYRKEPFVGFCALKHPFANRSVKLHELWEQSLLLREEGSGTRSILEKLLEGENRSIRDFRRYNSISNFGLLEHLVSRDCGITFAYRAVGEHNSALAEFTVEGWNISREFNYVYLPRPEAEKDIDFFDALR